MTNNLTNSARCPSEGNATAQATGLQGMPVAPEASPMVTNEGAGRRDVQPIQADAEQLAAQYGYDVDALKFQYDRRCFGSFSTTLAGSPEQRDRFLRAWVLAVRHAAIVQHESVYP